MSQKVKIAYRKTRLGMIVMPVSKKINDKIAKHLAKFGVEWEGIYLQGWEAEGVVETFTRSQRRDLENGWEVIVIEDYWDFLHGVGWDAHTLAE